MSRGQFLDSEAGGGGRGAARACLERLSASFFRCACHVVSPASNTRQSPVFRLPSQESEDLNRAIRLI